MDPENRQTIPEVKEGYGHDFYPVRWKAYSPKSEQFRKGIKGRWQRMNEYAGWDNCPKPSHIHQEVFDADAASARIADLERQLAEARAVKVKPLEWKSQTYKNPDQKGHHANGYSIYESQSGKCVLSSGPPNFFGPVHADCLEAAKAAAQADYEARILSALEPTEARAVSVPEAAKVPDWEGFSRAILESWPTGDIEGSILFEMALEYNMIAEVPGGYDPDQHIDAEGICPETGDPWYEYTFRALSGEGRP